MPCIIPDFVDLPIYFGHFIYISAGVCIAPVWIRTWRLRESKRMLKLSRHIHKQSCHLSPHLRETFSESLGIYSQVHTNLQNREPGLKGFWKHGLYRGWIDVSHGHTILQSETIQLKSKINLSERIEKQNIQNTIQFKVNSVLNHESEKETWRELEILMGQPAIFTSSTFGTDMERILRLQKLCKKLSEYPENQVFYATCKNWLLLREIGYWLTKMNEESFDDLHHYILDAKWDDEYENNSSVKYDKSNLNFEPETLIPPEVVKIDKNIQNDDNK